MKLYALNKLSELNIKSMELFQAALVLSSKEVMHLEIENHGKIRRKCGIIIIIIKALSGEKK